MQAAAAFGKRERRQQQAISRSSGRARRMRARMRIRTHGVSPWQPAAAQSCTRTEVDRDTPMPGISPAKNRMLGDSDHILRAETATIVTSSTRCCRFIARRHAPGGAPVSRAETGRHLHSAFACRVRCHEPSCPRRFHPAVAAWFTRAFAAPTRLQLDAWPAIHVAATRSSPRRPTVAALALLAAIDGPVRDGLVFGLPEQTFVVYVSPLKALSNDIDQPEAPLAGIRAELER